MELWDLYDSARRPMGRTHPRGRPLPPGACHLGVSVWVVNAQGEFLLTLRSPEKEVCPNEWENPGGAVQSGETSLQGALRELWEETGIRAQGEELQFVASRLESSIWMDTYLLRRALPRAVTLQPGETADARWVSLAELHRMMEQGLVAAPIVRTFRSLEPQLLALLHAGR